MNYYDFKFDWLQITVPPILVSPTYTELNITEPLLIMVRNTFNLISGLVPHTKLVETTISLKFYKLTLAVVCQFTGETLLTISAAQTNQGVCIQIPGGNHNLCFSLIHHPLFMHPETRVTRADLCLDIYEDDYEFNHLAGVLNNFATDNRYSTSVAGDWLNCKKGRTLYVGARTGFTMLRYYEKSLQLQLPDNHKKYNRLEFEFKPMKVSEPVKGFMHNFKLSLLHYFNRSSYLSPFSFSNFAQKSIELVANSSIKKVESSARKEKKVLFSFAHMLFQYSTCVKSVKEDYSINLDELFELVAFAKKAGTTENDIKCLLLDYLHKSKY
tara:strand:- start:3226 stop:4206 length:981 start_codon:yes stop_codon:yes gene_type:complete